ncbi:hypothetical protein [Accumulibacter sp.]|uniref:hypothetical protein n=1 Tax=Accumulibacter sp. TaxID=2053492 RepID=UPI0025B93961|nr:hypothetical protein [Accumulibacter sp.]
MLHHQVTESRRVDYPRLRLADFKAVVRLRAIAAVGEPLMEGVEIARQVFFEGKAGTLAVLVAGGGVKRGQQRLSGKRLLVKMANAPHVA